jgi:hypothetical protein
MKKLRLQWVLLLTLILLTAFAGISSAADVKEPGDVNLKFDSEDVFVFKNGIGLIVKSGVIENFDGTAVTDDVPNALMGNIITYVDDKDAEIKSVTSYRETVEYESEVNSIDGLLGENVGKKVQIINFQDHITTGTLVMSSDNSTLESYNNPFSSRLSRPTGAGFVIIKNAEGNAIIKKTDIKNIVVLDEVDVSTKSSKEEPRMKFDIDSKKKTVKVTIAYLINGVRWIPLYKVDLKDNYEAEIALDAQIVNDSEDILDADFHLIVGAPNFKFSKDKNPFSAFANHVISIARQSDPLTWGSQNINLSNAYASQRVGGANFASQQPTEYTPPDYEISGKIGSKNEDTFVYELTGLSLKYGERSIVNLFKGNITYEDIYKVNIIDKFTSAEGSGSAYSGGSIFEHNINDVWHIIRLGNKTGVPWTTGIATVFRNNMPISQDLMKYTPTDTDFDLKLMISSDIFVTERGNETSREKGKGRYYWSSYYDKATIESEIMITNAKDKDVNLEVTKTFFGDDITASLNGKARKSPVGLRMVNPSAEIKWVLDLKEREVLKLDYGFTTWVRR